MAQDVTHRALCYIRQLSGIAQNLHHSWAPRFIDTTAEKKLDQASNSLLANLVSSKVPGRLENQNIRQYDTPWTGDPLENSTDKEHKAYLQRFCEDFVKDMKVLIEKSVNKTIKLQNPEMSQVYNEILQHGHFAKMKCQTFCGRERIIDMIKEYVTCNDKPQGHAPLVIYGKSGYGKTSIIAKATECMKQWLGQDAVVIVRFLGTSPQSSTIRPLLTSLINQLSHVYETPKTDDLENFSDTLREFFSLIEIAENQSMKQPLVILLDSLDQLSAIHGAFKLLWLPKLLHQQVYIVLSVLDDRRYDFLWGNLRKRIPDQNQFIEVSAIPTGTGEEIVNTFLNNNQRTLTENQKLIVLEAFSKNHQALFLKLLLDNAKLWHSYTQSEEIAISSTVQEAISLLFSKSEDKYGKVFVNHALGYLTAGKDGLSGIEMEDVLSCDDDVLNEIYQYHDPPVDGFIRIPSLMWSRLQYEIREYIVERQADGKSVMAWYHRQFWETAENRYLSTKEKRRMIHASLAKIYMTETTIRKTIKLNKRKGKVIENADRQVTPQPLTVKNLRKLSCLPFHLLHAGHKEELKSCCLLNFNWVLTKLKGTSATVVLNEFDEMESAALLINDNELGSMHDFLLLASNVLHTDPDELAFHLLEILREAAQSSELIQTLLNDAKDWITENKMPLLSPTHPLGLQTAAGPLRLSLLAGFRGETLPDKSTVVCSWNEKETSKINIWNTAERDLVASIETSGEVPFAITPDGSHLAYVNNGQFCLADAESGEKVLDMDFMAVFERDCKKLYIRAVAISDDARFAAVGVKAQVPRGTKAWKHISCIFVLDLMCKNVFFHHEFSQRQIQHHIDKLEFSTDGGTLVILFYEHIVTLALSELGHSEDNPGIRVVGDIKDIKAATFKKYKVNGEDVLVGGIGGQFNGLGQVCIYYISTGEHELSGNAHITDDKATPFDVQAKCDLSLVAIGLAEDGKKRNNSLCIWNRQKNELEHIQLQDRDKKFPRKLVVADSWMMVAIGWEDGTITVVDVQSKAEVHKIKAHDRGITHMELYGKHFLTMGWDHALKLWDVDRLTKEVELNIGGKLVKSTLRDVPYLDEDEECTSIGVVNKYAITAPPAPNDAVRFWNLHDATLDEAIKSKLDPFYKEMYIKMKLDTGRKMADFYYLKDGTILVDIRRSRRRYMMFVIDLQKQEIIQQTFTKGIYRLLVTNSCKVIEVKDGWVTILDLITRETLKTIEYPKLSENVSKNCPKGYITVDESYLILCTVIPPEKCAYIIDLAKGKFVCLIEFPDEVSLHFLEDGVYFLVLCDTTAEILSPDNLKEKRNYSYVGLISSFTFVSKDTSFGGSYCADNTVNIWNLQTSPPKLQCKLVGHLHQIRSISFSRDNKYIVTGSFDSTVRVWNTESGQQLCMFFVAGAVDNAYFDQHTTYIVVHCYSAPKKKRAIVLRTHNLIRE